ncbi:MAG: class I SAM-dependent methyltransferase [Gammaproteobacteria bacterium]
MTQVEIDYVEVSEVAGEPMSGEQLERLQNRYLWARRLCKGGDVVEVACGTGPGLGLLKAVAKSLVAGDVSDTMVARCRSHYGNRISVSRFDAQALPFPDSSKDVVIICEALYYVPNIDKFLDESRRVLRPNGQLLVVVANKDLPDFNPSPHSHVYLGPVELNERLSRRGFAVRCFGYLPIDTVSLLQRILRPMKRLAVALGVVPKTMKGKQLLKRLIFGRLVSMPAELTEASRYVEPVSIPADVPDRRHKVIYCAAVLQ